MKANKSKKTTAHQPSSVLRGREKKADYRSQAIDEYKGNPLIEALPELIPPKEVIKQLAYFPPYSPEYRERPAEERIHMLDNAREFYLPSSRNIELHYSISNMIRRSYINRNPVELGYWSEHDKKVKSLENIITNNQPFTRRLSSRSKPRGTAIIGQGGNGKSSAVESELYLYPQVIVHENYEGSDFIMKQLVWLKLDCPAGGSLKSLCLEFFHAADEVLGTNYFNAYGVRRRSVDQLLIDMARVASMHSLGVLVIDEIQDLSKAKSGGADHMLNFFVHLENRIGVPYILVGTPDASDLFTSQFRHARRASEQGDFYWDRMKMVSDEDPTKPDEDWDDFIRAMWTYQYTTHVTPLPDNILDSDVVRTIYNYSQGIPAIVHTLFFLAQERAITSEEERLSVRIIRSAEKDRLKMIRNQIDKIRAGINDETNGNDLTASRYLALRRLQRLLNLGVKTEVHDMGTNLDIPISELLSDLLKSAQEKADSQPEQAPAKNGKKASARGSNTTPPASQKVGTHLAENLKDYIGTVDEFFSDTDGGGDDGKSKSGRAAS